MSKPDTYKLSAILSVLLIALAVHISQREVKAGPPSGGSVTGMIKLDGTAPPRMAGWQTSWYTSRKAGAEATRQPLSR